MNIRPRLFVQLLCRRCVELGMAAACHTAKWLETCPHARIVTSPRNDLLKSRLAMQTLSAPTARKDANQKVKVDDALLALRRDHSVVANHAANPPAVNNDFQYNLNVLESNVLRVHAEFVIRVSTFAYVHRSRQRWSRYGSQYTHVQPHDAGGNGKSVVAIQLTQHP